MRLLDIPIPHLPLDPFVAWGGGFTDDELEGAVKLGELFEFQKGRVGGSVTDMAGDLNEATRVTDVAFLEPSERTEWLYKKMGRLVAHVNHEKFGFDLQHLQALQYTKYNVGGHYNWHTDSGPNMPIHRKLSIILALNDPKEYEGGDLEINAGGDHEKSVKIRLEKGHMLAFPSWVPHRVLPVTFGVRLTLVGWVVGPRFK